jgi:hypothetical protein
MGRGFVAFGLGVAAALALGWLAFPRAVYVRRAQPVEFRHKIHAEKSGVTQCGDCHTLRADGAFEGIPRAAACAGCHTDPVGSSKAEATLVNDYIKKGREVDWLESSRQPDNVWFSHAIHIKRAGLKCAECHQNYGESATQPADELNRISGYHRRTLDMSVCEDCHRKRGAQAGCLGCHK